MSIGTGTHFSSPILGGRDLYEDVPLDILSRSQRCGQFIDFQEAYSGATNGIMTTTVITSGTGEIVGASANGIFRLNATVANQGIGSSQHSGVGHAATMDLDPSATAAIDGSLHRMMAWGARVSVSDWSDCDWFVGLGPTDATFMAADGTLLAVGGDNHVGFHHLVADGNDVRLSSAGTAVGNTQVTLLSAAQAPRAVPADAVVDGVFFEYGIRIFSTNQIEFYINRVLRHRRTMANALATNLLTTFTMIANGNAIDMDVDYFWYSQTR